MIFPGQTFINGNTKEGCGFNLSNSFIVYMLILIVWFGFLFEDLTKIIFVFVVFRNNLFTFNHSITLSNSVCIMLLSVYRLVAIEYIGVISK